MSWAFKELLVCMCRLRHHHVCMTIRITVTTFWVLKERVACNFLVCHSKWNRTLGGIPRCRWESMPNIVGRMRGCWLRYFRSQGNVQWRLVFVVVNLRIFSTRRMNSRMTISFRKREPHLPPLYHIAGCGALEKNCVKQELKRWPAFLQILNIIKTLYCKKKRCW